jgi:hypothetical protein
LLKANSQSTASVQELFWTAQDPPRITQATLRDNNKPPKTFRCNGSTLPITITCQYQTQTNAEVKPGTSSYYYLPDQTVQDEVRQTKESLNNEHLTVIDTHLATFKAAYNLLTHSQKDNPDPDRSITMANSKATREPAFNVTSRGS